MTKLNKKIINIHYQCSLPDPTPSASSLKTILQISDFDTYSTYILHYSIYDDAVYPWEYGWRADLLPKPCSYYSVQLSIDSTQCQKGLNNTLSRIFFIKYTLTA